MAYWPMPSDGILFALKNCHNIPAREFPVQDEKQDRVLSCGSRCGPCFGDSSVSAFEINRPPPNPGRKSI
jgi:hypothetical protein